MVRAGVCTYDTWQLTFLTFDCYLIILFKKYNVGIQQAWSDIAQLCQRKFHSNVNSINLFYNLTILFHNETRRYYRDVAGAVVVYDITSMDSFNESKTWLDELRKHTSTFILLVNTNADTFYLSQTT